MFPLLKKEIGGYSYGQKTSYSLHHLGVDYRANYDQLFAPFDGTVKQVNGVEGGLTIWFYPDGLDVIIRFMHLSEFKANGKVKEGDLIAITGNTGKLSTSPHLHLDISNHSVDINNFSNFIDPESFNWEKYMTYDLFDYKGDVYERLNNYALVKIPSPEFADKYYGKNWSSQVKPCENIDEIGWIAEDPRPLKERIIELENRPPQVQKVTTEKIVPQIIEKDILTDEEKNQFIKEYEKTHPPIVKTEYVTRDITIRELIIAIWNKIKGTKLPKE